MTEQNRMGAEILKKISDNINKVMKGQTDTIRLLLAGFAGDGHILLEDYPGTGKTTMAKTLARSMDTAFKRVQFTPDLLPTDILGVSIFDPQERLFQLHKGPIFTNILLVDEINRASPRTQSALLEAMAEKQVSIDGKIWHLEELFFVIATQNPVESHGTYPLPEAQMDRFALQLSLGYVSADEETAMLSAQEQGHPIENVTACVSLAEVAALKKEVETVFISDELKAYIVDIAKATRSAPGVLLGASPRASLALMKIAKALALLDAGEFVTPEHIQELVVPVIAHRLVLDHQARFAGQTAAGILEDLLPTIPVPS